MAKTNPFKKTKKTAIQYLREEFEKEDGLDTSEEDVINTNFDLHIAPVCEKRCLKYLNGCKGFFTISKTAWLKCPDFKMKRKEKSEDLDDEIENDIVEEVKPKKRGRPKKGDK